MKQIFLLCLFVMKWKRKQQIIFVVWSFWFTVNVAAGCYKQFDTDDDGDDLI